MGIIEIEEMEFYAYHGCFKEEQVVGNKFLVDLRLEAECTKASETDDINDAVNYQHAYDIIAREVAVASHLLEHVCRRILDGLYAEMEGIHKATVKVRKMNPPMGGQIMSTSVTMSR